MPFVIALSGNISAGKTMLAKRLAKHFGVEHLSSDEIRSTLAGPGTKGQRVFAEMRRRAFKVLQSGDSVILDSTGMSDRYRALVDDLRKHCPVVALDLFCSPDAWRVREKTRTDRPGLPINVYVQSLEASTSHDYAIDTSLLTPDQVFTEALLRLPNANTI